MSRTEPVWGTSTLSVFPSPLDYQNWRNNGMDYINRLLRYGRTFDRVAHLHHCWMNPPVKTAAAPAAESLVLLLPPATEPHPFELSLERMPALGTIAAVRQPAAYVEPSIKLAAEAPAKSPECPADGPIALAGMNIRELKRIASERKLPRYSSMTKSQLIAVLSE